MNVDPLKSELKDEEERARLARIFEQGLDQVVGYVLPLHAAPRARRRRDWASGAWFLRSEHLFLIPGDSPIGYRLPLDSLPWVAPGEIADVYEADPFARRAAAAADASSTCAADRAGAAPRGERRIARRRRQRGESAVGVVRTALCVEPRHGRLHVFMPPVGRRRTISI